MKAQGFECIIGNSRHRASLDCQILTLRGQDVSLGFGGPRLFDGINLQIEQGERVGLLGRNGAGKSTLLKLVNGDFSPHGGTVSR